MSRARKFKPVSGNVRWWTGQLVDWSTGEV